MAAEPHFADLEYADRAEAYARAVVKGTIPACVYVKQACKRHLDDLKRKRFRYVFDKSLANRACRFIENMPHVKGRWARRRREDPTGHLIRLEDWQCFQVCCVFGWVDKKTALRRFNLVYIEVPRKNAKSTLAAAIGLYMLTADSEEGPEVYSAATTKDQARIVFTVAREMARKSPRFRDKFGVEVQTHNIVTPSHTGIFTSLASDSSSLDGLNPNCSLVDELHAHKDRKVYDVLETATGSRDQPLLFVITTAGSNLAGICYEVRSYVLKILRNAAKDDSVFGVVYTIDEDDEWTDPQAWRKANPNFGVSVSGDDLERLCRKAQKTPSAVNNFLTKRLNKWVNAEMPWLDMDRFRACVTPSMALDDFEGRECFIACDLSSKLDFACKARLFWREIDGETHFFAFVRHYLPQEAIDSGDNDQYTGWSRSGFVEVVEGARQDYELIQHEIIGGEKCDGKCDLERFDVLGVGFDPWQAAQIVKAISDAGHDATEIRQTVGNFSEPMKELEALIVEGRFHVLDDPVLEWMASNVVCHYDKKDNVFPNKEFPQNKIDGMVALIMALAMYLAYQDNTVSFADGQEIAA